MMMHGNIIDTMSICRKRPNLLSSRQNHAWYVNMTYISEIAFLLYLLSSRSFDMIFFRYLL